MTSSIFLLQEAVASSRIEGVSSSLEELLIEEALRFAAEADVADQVESWKNSRRFAEGSPAHRVLDVLTSRARVTTAGLQKALDLSPEDAKQAIRELMEDGILVLRDENAGGATYEAPEQVRLRRSR